jgi:hypothetical protein
MSEQERNEHRVIIYTTSMRLSGEISCSPLLRFSDAISDISSPFVLLENAMLTTWRKGCNTTNLEQVAVTKENVLAFLLEPGSPPSRTKEVDRVLKDPQRMSVFAPPFLLSGCMHVPPKAHWLRALNGSRLNFLNFTDVALYHWDSQEELESIIPFAMVNRKYVTALLPEIQDFPVSVWGKENKIFVALHPQSKSLTIAGKASRCSSTDET